MLSDVQIRAWVKAARPVAKSDGHGLTFTLSAKGAAAWVLRYRFGGKARELTLGRYPDVSLAEARKRALEARGKVQGGTDVAREKRQIKIERAAAQSFSQLAADYMTKAFPALAANTVSQRKRHIEQIIVPRLGALPARDVNTADVVALVETVGTQRSKNVAELVLTAISEIFKHGLARHVVIANPCAPISAAAIVGKPEPRRRRLKLTEDELRAFSRRWHDRRAERPHRQDPARNLCRAWASSRARSGATWTSSARSGRFLARTPRTKPPSRSPWPQPWWAGSSASMYLHAAHHTCCRLDKTGADAIAAGRSTSSSVRSTPCCTSSAPGWAIAAGALRRMTCAPLHEAILQRWA